METDFLSVRSSSNTEFRVTCGEMVINDMIRKHKEIVFAMLKKGSITVWTDTGTHRLIQGDIFFIAPNQKYKIDNDFEAKVKAVFFNLNSSAEITAEVLPKSFIMGLMMGNCTEFVKLSPGDLVYNKILSAFETIYKAELEKQEFFELLVHSKMYEFFYFLLSSGLIKIYDVKTKGKKYYAMREITEYINDNYCGGITLSSISQTTGFSRYYISHLFKDIMNSTFIAYINELRVTRAASLLATTEIPIADIAKMSGFHNISNFNRTFKMYYKDTPSKYRKRE